MAEKKNSQMEAMSAMTVAASRAGASVATSAVAEASRRGGSSVASALTQEEGDGGGGGLRKRKTVPDSYASLADGESKRDGDSENSFMNNESLDSRGVFSLGGAAGMHTAEDNTKTMSTAALKSLLAASYRDTEPKSVEADELPQDNDSESGRENDSEGPYLAPTEYKAAEAAVAEARMRWTWSMKASSWGTLERDRALLVVGLVVAFFFTAFNVYFCLDTITYVAQFKRDRLESIQREMMPVMGLCNAECIYPGKNLSLTHGVRKPRPMFKNWNLDPLPCNRFTCLKDYEIPPGKDKKPTSVWEHMIDTTGAELEEYSEKAMLNMQLLTGKDDAKNDTTLYSCLLTLKNIALNEKGALYSSQKVTSDMKYVIDGFDKPKMFKLFGCIEGNSVESLAKYNLVVHVFRCPLDDSEYAVDPMTTKPAPFCLVERERNGTHPSFKPYADAAAKLKTFMTIYVSEKLSISDVDKSAKLASYSEYYSSHSRTHPY